MSGRGKVLLHVEDLDKSFGGVHAVNHISFDLHEGEVLGLIGPNGSGKSTTVNLIAGTIVPDSGSLLYDGKSISRLSVAARAKTGICRTFQTPKAFAGITVFNSVFTIALQHGTFAQAAAHTEEILSTFGLWGMRNDFSEKLSIEKRKQLDLARIMALKPRIIMLDEVMAGLNPAEMAECVELVRKINKMGISILFIEHVMRAVSTLCERVIVLADGKLLSEGKPEIVLNDPTVVEAYLGKGKRNAGS